MFVLKCIPIVGTVITVGEAVGALIDGDGKGFAVKAGQALVGGALDTAFIMTGGLSSFAGVVGKKAVENVAIQAAGKLTANIAARGVCEYVADKVTDDSGKGFTSINKANARDNNDKGGDKDKNDKGGDKGKKDKDDDKEDETSESEEEDESSQNEDEDELIDLTNIENLFDNNFPFVRTLLIQRDPIVLGYRPGTPHPLLNATLTGNLNGNIIHVNDFSPFIEYSLRQNGTAEYVRAEIRRSHLNTGENTRANQVLARTIQKLGDGGDHAGHILGNQFGGLMRPYNLYPQNPSINTGNWREEYEMTMRNWLVRGGENANIQFQLRLIYQDDQATRPLGFYYLIIFRIADRIANSNEVIEATNQGESILFGEPIPNPPSNVHITREGEEDYKEQIKEAKNKVSKNVKRRKK